MAKVVLIHGAWHGAWCWDAVVAELRQRGVEATAVELPLTGFAADLAAARAAIQAAGSDAIVVGHSYGGRVITQAAIGLPVARLVYVAAYLDDPREADVPTTSSLLAASLLFDGLGMRVDPQAAAAVFYGDTDAQTATAWVARLRPMPLEHPGVSDAEAAWRSIPSTYLVCTNDQALPPVSQREMAAHASEVVEWPTDHSPFLTRPAELAELIVRGTPDGRGRS
ncbi:alpha/beta fold hydrolase [Streptomyces pseudovenezuelae]|uniref:alpha/beta fold hydrolase n=1 Tax=Streptomyces pseudovenezuelae TaxID=67350 RepID=UPI002E808973|nr:alpha/beta fold hydrolase [Streptomyces pseudovenezuelae]WUA93645.1 alpha/beta fold hydrolase [Streptomyces pseudovenezuelae]